MPQLELNGFVPTNEYHPTTKKYVDEKTTESAIKTSYEANDNTNEFSDAEKTKLASVESGATGDQTDTEIETSYNNQVPEITDQEKLDGTVDEVRRVSPKDLKDAANIHGGGDTGVTSFNSRFGPVLPVTGDYNSDQVTEGSSNEYYTESKVTANTNVTANTTHRTSDGSDHTFINQNVTTTGTPTFEELTVHGVTSGAWAGSSTYNAIGLAGAIGPTSYNFLSLSTGGALYVNRAAGGDIRFREENVDQLAIATGGKVGIGTSMPTSKFQVVGLQTTTVGLTAGAFWNNGGVVNVV